MWWIVSGPPKTLVASAYCATRRSVFCSPPPPIMIGDRGRLIDWGEFSRCIACVLAALERRLRAALARPHVVGQRRVSSSMLEPLAERREREPEPARLLLVPGGADASQARPPDSTSSVVVALIQSPGCAVVDAADHEAEPRPLRVRGHEPERRQALEHRLLGAADAPDLEEVVHDPDRVEAGLVGVADDAGERGADGLVPPGQVNEEICSPTFMRASVAARRRSAEEVVLRRA